MLSNQSTAYDDQNQIIWNLCLVILENGSYLEREYFQFCCCPRLQKNHLTFCCFLLVSCNEENISYWRIILWFIKVFHFYNTLPIFFYTYDTIYVQSDTRNGGINIVKNTANKKNLKKPRNKRGYYIKNIFVVQVPSFMWIDSSIY